MRRPSRHAVSIVGMAAQLQLILPYNLTLTFRSTYPSHVPTILRTFSIAKFHWSTSDKIVKELFVPQMPTEVSRLGDLVFGSVILFSLLIVVFEWVERRRESQRERRILDAIEREYELYRRAGRL